MSNIVHQTFMALIDAPSSKRLTPALLHANEVVDLTGPQLVALNALLKSFEAHPKIRNAESYLQNAERLVNSGNASLSVTETRHG